MRHQKMQNSVQNVAKSFKEELSMKKGFKYYAVIWIICLSVFNLVIFVTPSEIAGVSKYGSSFWVGFVFILLAFAGQLICSYIFFKSDSNDKYFLNLPLISLSYTGLIISVIVGSIFMALPILPNWIGIIADVIIFAIYAIATIQAKGTADAVGSIDKNIKTQTFFIKSLTIDLETLTAKAKNDEIKSEVKKIAETCRYSDPMSNDALAGVESQITIKFNALEKAVEENRTDDIKSICEEMNILLADRNKKCKLLK